VSASGASERGGRGRLAVPATRTELRGNARRCWNGMLPPIQRAQAGVCCRAGARVLRAAAPPPPPVLCWCLYACYFALRCRMHSICKPGEGDSQNGACITCVEFERQKNTLGRSARLQGAGCWQAADATGLGKRSPTPAPLPIVDAEAHSSKRDERNYKKNLLLTKWCGKWENETKACALVRE
jgi:hypothetical protein